MATVLQNKKQDGENAEEWMGRLQPSAIECNYKELHGQLKEQFIHGLNDTAMLGKTIWELTKIKENEKNHELKCVILGKESQSTKSPIFHHE